MQAITTGTLAKWGNSQGIRIPKDMCELLGARIGTPVDIRADQAKSELVIKFARPDDRYRRNRKVSMEELCSDWTGGKVGEEWGGPDVGLEVVD